MHARINTQRLHTFMHASMRVGVCTYAYACECECVFVHMHQSWEAVVSYIPLAKPTLKWWP